MREFFEYKCPHCLGVRNAVEVAAELQDEVLRLIAGRRNALRRRTRRAGAGRPTKSRCPGCSQKMSAGELRDHRIPCIRRELQEIRGMVIQLAPKDPDPYPDFYLNDIYDSDVAFQKGSNGDIVTVDLRKIAEININRMQRTASIRVHGRVQWCDDIKRWQFSPTAPIGRPPQLAGKNV